MFWEFIQQYQSISFLIYLFPLGTALVLMIRRSASCSRVKTGQTKPLIWAVALLFCGDTLHLSTMALQTALPLHPVSVPAVGEKLAWTEIGGFVTSLTLTLFYMSLLRFIRRSMDQPRKDIETVIIGALWIRLLLLFVPAKWTGVSTGVWLIIQNIPFFMGGIGASYLFMHWQTQDAVIDTRWMDIGGWSIALSFAFYLMSLLFAGQHSFVWMSMAAKSLCYLTLVFSLYQALFVRRSNDQHISKFYLS